MRQILKSLWRRCLREADGTSGVREFASEGGLACVRWVWPGFCNRRRQPAYALPMLALRYRTALLPRPLDWRAAAAEGLRAVAAALAPRSDAHDLTRADRRLAYRLFVRFERWGEGAGTGLHFHVQRGAVTVLGTIAGPDARAAVLRAVGQTPGVLRVTDRLTQAEA